MILEEVVDNGDDNGEGQGFRKLAIITKSCAEQRVSLRREESE